MRLVLSISSPKIIFSRRRSRRQATLVLLRVDDTGICVAPGSGFGKEGEWNDRPTFSFRATGVDYRDCIAELKQFHPSFTQKWTSQKGNDV